MKVAKIAACYVERLELPEEVNFKSGILEKSSVNLNLTNYNKNTLNFENAMHKVLHERRGIAASLKEHL